LQPARLISGVFGVCLGVACGESSKTGTGALVDAPPGVGGSAPRSCTVDGVTYESGEKFGTCNECDCADGTPRCFLVLCPPGTGGGGGDVGQAGADGDAAAGAAVIGVGGAAGAGMARGGAGSGAAGSGAAGSGGMGGAGRGGQSGIGGAAPQCEYADIGQLCVQGEPAGDGEVEVAVGMPLRVLLEPSGCFSSSCTRLVSSSCNYIGSDRRYWVTGFVCLATEGDACTDDCGGAPPVSCEPGITLEEGTYELGLSGSAVSIQFTVPSRVRQADLCVPATTP
jgi:hypothetical protein